MQLIIYLSSTMRQMPITNRLKSLPSKPNLILRALDAKCRCNLSNILYVLLSAEYIRNSLATFASLHYVIFCVIFLVVNIF